MDPQGKVILVTEASSGIGLASARELAHEGAKVVLAARSSTRLERAAEAIRQRSGEALAITMDVGDAASVSAGITRALAHYGHIDAASTSPAMQVR